MFLKKNQIAFSTSAWRALLIFAVILGFVHCKKNAASESLIKNNFAEKNNMKLIWSDEFDGDTLNTNKWGYIIGDGCPSLCGWGNQELEYYRKNNISQKDGILTITAKKETFNNRKYTSGRITTSGKFSTKYGRIDVKARLPKGKGVWPAIWMLGDNIKSIGWPGCGEIDIMELRGSRPNTVCGTIHFKNKSLRHEFPKSGCNTLENKIYNDGFHVFSLLWDEEKLIWLVDDKEFNRAVYRDLNLADGSNPFQNSFYILLNLAIGGMYDGNPDSTTVFPQVMEVDYVRVYN